MNSAETVPLPKINLLLVDDEPHFLRSMSKRLELRGFHVIAADRGEKAVETARGKPVDIALVDLKMPGIGGEQTLRTLKEEHPWMEIIILTGHGSIDSAVRCAKVGACSYLEKPCEWDRLLQALADAYKEKVTNRARRDETRMQQLLQISISQSPLGILRSLRELDSQMD